MKNQSKAIVIGLLLGVVAWGHASAQRLSDRYFGISQQVFTDTIIIKMWDGAIGSSILEHVSLIIDAPKKSFYFLPNDGNPEITVNNKPRGLNLVAAEEGDPLGAMKAIVRKGTEAYAKGIRTGDYLVSANGTPITSQCDYMLLTRQESVKRFVFRTPEGEIKEIEW